MASSRRNLLVGGLVLAGGYGAVRFGLQSFTELFADELEFEPIADPAGFRRISGGPSSVGFDPFFGLDDGDGSGRAVAVADVRRRLCAALFGTAQPDPDVVPVASFSDYYCPYCRVLTQKLASLEESADGAIRVEWHELPLLGEASLAAAKAALAAERQGAYVAFHRRLMRTPFRPTRGYISRLAADLGVDETQMIADMDGAEVLAEIGESGALARLFGFIGTPALVVGRTVVQGEVDDGTLRRLIERERADGPIPACA